MLDTFNIPNNQDNISIFYANGSTWQTWKKPRNCSHVFMIAIGSGGGGGGGIIGVAGGQSNVTGGGGGGVTRAMFSANLLPDLLYVQVGLGGLGATTQGGTGGAGNKSYVSLTPTVTINNLVIVSGAIAATGGQSGAISNLGETVAVNTSANILPLSNYTSTLGMSATQGFQTAQPTDLSPLTSQITTSGGAGAPGAAGVSAFNGAGWSATTFSPKINGGIGSQFTGGTGDNGITIWKPFFSVGGAGGGSGYDATLGTGGNGGNGGIGSGGGAGGNGVLKFGNGGNGGDGIVFIIAI